MIFIVYERQQKNCRFVLTTVLCVSVFHSFCLFSDMENVIGQKKGSCGHFMSIKDFHESCRVCRKCSRELPCSVCTTWTSDDWSRLVSSPRRRSDKKTKRSETRTPDISHATDQGTVSTIQDGSDIQYLSAERVGKFVEPSVGITSSGPHVDNNALPQGGKTRHTSSSGTTPLRGSSGRLTNPPGNQYLPVKATGWVTGTRERYLPVRL